jgi:uncharacterized protein (TIGR00255 family)
MIQSMTGFARISTPTPSGQVSWELRSVNHRHLDLHFHLPEQWRELETELRPLFQSSLGRGKVDIYLHCSADKAISSIQLNIPAVSALAETHRQLQAHLPHMADINMFDLLKWPGVMMNEPVSNNELKKLLLTSFNDALATLVTQREREGATLTGFLQNKFAEILEKVKIIPGRREQVLTEQREKFLSKIESLAQPFDSNRLEQELLIWAQKSDINEENERLITHVNEALKILKKAEKSIGRQLEFLLQEINREANTLASKSTDIPLTNAAVDIKVYLEQIREQLQNIA